MGDESQAADSRAPTEGTRPVTTIRSPALLEWLEKNFACRAVLIYGSAIHGEVQPESDIDLLGLTEGAHLRSVQARFAEQDVDLLLGSAGVLEQMMERDVEGNGNFVLRAFVYGRVLRDPEGALAKLIDRANLLWAQGPRMVGERERRRIRARSLKISGATRRLERTTARDSAHARLQEVQLSLFLDLLIKDFCRIHRRWASSLREMSQNTDFGQLQVFLHAYLHSTDAAERARSLTGMSRVIADSARV